MKKYKVPMPKKARVRLWRCRICGRKETEKFFRKNKLICRECLKNNKTAVRKLYGCSVKRKPEPVIDRETWEKNLSVLTKHFRKKLEETNKEKEVKKVAEEKAVKYLKFPERVAAIVGKTYAVMGDDFKLADDEALTRIRDLLDELDETIVARNKKKRLSK